MEANGHLSVARRRPGRGIYVLAAATLAAALSPAPARAQLDASTLRGVIADPEGRPLEGVTVEMEFKGESRAKIVKTATTDKKGAYIRVGMKPGPWSILFRKEGYKTAHFETNLSGGGISEIPPLKMSLATGGPTAGATLGAPGPASAGTPAGTPAAAGPEAASKQLTAMYAKGVDAMRAGRSAEAEEIFKAVVAAAPRVGPAHYNLGYLYALRGDAAGAEGEYRKAIEMEPTSSDSYIALTALLARAQKDEEALKVLTDAAPQFASDGRFQFALGATAFNMGRADVAEAAFLKAAELDTANPESLFYLGSIAVSRNDVKGAIERLEKYLAAASADAPNRPAAKALLATLKKTK